MKKVLMLMLMGILVSAAVVLIFGKNLILEIGKGLYNGSKNAINEIKTRINAAKRHEVERFLGV